MDATKSDTTVCPICTKMYLMTEIEEHANRCIFLNCSNNEMQKRKRSPSPLLPPSHHSHPKFGLQHKSPKGNNSTMKLFENAIAEVDKSSQKCKISGPEPSNSEMSQEHEKKDTLSFVVPLAKQVQPRSLDQFFGQSHVLGRNTVLRSLLEKKDIPNMILWGPPGCGKTSLSGVVNEICKTDPRKLKFISLCAASTGVKEVQNVITLARNDMKFGKRTILFMDEIHRFNKRQQDSFLLSVEKGEITLIGATTENPSFVINSALLSRCRVIVMEKLQPDDLYSILERAANSLNVCIVDTENLSCISEDDKNSATLTIEDKALKWLADISDGDARIALSNLQLVVQHNSKDGKFIAVEDIKDEIKKSHMLYDRAGEEHYNIISAMHKSIRGSDPNAALYWTTRMIVSGEDPRFIARRLVRAASEDIGNADPFALQLAVSTMEGCQLLGMPEADVLLAQCAIYLARAPKSREADSALAKAKQVIANCKGPQPAVPLHLRNAPTKLMKDLGYGKLQSGSDRLFMPPDLKDVDFFK